jgi:DNA-binding transcriptional MerR regulator
MVPQKLKTLKQIADQFHRPAHRIIHLCETGVIRPTVDAQGRGTMRRFSRDDTFRILVALQLQEAGVQVPLIKPLMEAFDRLLEIPDIEKKRKPGWGPFDLVHVIRSHLGSDSQPAIAFLTPPDRVALVTPRFIVPKGPDVRVDLHMSDHLLSTRGVSIVVNLTQNADYVANTLWQTDYATEVTEEA